MIRFAIFVIFFPVFVTFWASEGLGSEATQAYMLIFGIIILSWIAESIVKRMKLPKDPEVIR